MQKTFVLVHGAFAGKYAWDKVKPLLEKDGNHVITFDLPGHGEDPTPAGQTSFDMYVEKTAAVINEQSGKVILIGHSMGGMVISAVAEKIADKIEKLVYLSAYLPKDGDDLQTLGTQDAESLIGPNLQFAADFSGASLPENIAVQVFAGDCTDDIKELVKAKSRLEPLAAFQTKVALSSDHFGSVPKYYIETLKDQGVGNILQKKMVMENGTILKIFSLDCSHSPYFAKPEELAAILQSI